MINDNYYKNNWYHNIPNFFFCIEIIAQISVSPVGVSQRTRIYCHTQTGQNGCIKMFHTIV